MTPDPDLRATFEQVRDQASPPPHQLTPTALIRAGHRSAVRRRAAILAASAAAVVALAVPVALSLTQPSGPPMVPGNPSPAVTEPTQVPTPSPVPSPSPVSTGGGPSIEPSPGQSVSVPTPT